MAISKVWMDESQDFATSFEAHDYAIGGKMVVATCHINELELLSNKIKDMVRHELIHQMANYILENKLVEFTQHQDPIHMKTVVRARCYLAPNDQVKILRSVYKV